MHEVVRGGCLYWYINSTTEKINNMARIGSGKPKVPIVMATMSSIIAPHHAFALVEFSSAQLSHSAH